jgi:hypothetical protein
MWKFNSGVWRDEISNLGFFPPFEQSNKALEIRGHTLGDAILLGQRQLA